VKKLSALFVLHQSLLNFNHPKKQINVMYYKTFFTVQRERVVENEGSTVLGVRLLVQLAKLKSSL